MQDIEQERESCKTCSSLVEQNVPRYGAGGALGVEGGGVSESTIEYRSCGPEPEGFSEIISRATTVASNMKRFKKFEFNRRSILIISRSSAHSIFQFIVIMLKCISPSYIYRTV